MSSEKSALDVTIDRLDHAVTNVAQCARGVSDGAYEMRDGGQMGFFVGHDDMNELREALDAWCDACDAFGAALRASPVEAAVREEVREEKV